MQLNQTTHSERFAPRGYKGKRTYIRTNRSWSNSSVAAKAQHSLGQSVCTPTSLTFTPLPFDAGCIVVTLFCYIFSRQKNMQLFRDILGPSSRHWKAPKKINRLLAQGYATEFQLPTKHEPHSVNRAALVAWSPTTPKSWPAPSIKRPPPTDDPKWTQCFFKNRLISQLLSFFTIWCTTSYERLHSTIARNDAPNEHNPGGRNKCAEKWLPTLVSLTTLQLPKRLFAKQGRWLIDNRINQ